MELLQIYQVYYKEGQLPYLEYTPYYNDNCTPYFENSVMVDLINSDAHKNAKYFGVLSHQFRTKIKDRTYKNWDATPFLKNIKDHQVNIEAELLKGVDILNLMKHYPHNPINYGDFFQRDLSKYFKLVIEKIGYKWRPAIYENVYYCNYFIAPNYIYENYVKTMLEPAIKVMDQMPELWSNAGYPFALPDNLKQKWGVNFYPYHAFVCERLFSYYCHINKI